jgi:hypothetical protein
MGVEFIMHENEEQKLIDFIIDSGDIAVISAASPEPRPMVMDGFHKRGDNIFWDKAYLARKSDLDRIEMSYVKSCGHFIIKDTCEAPVIELRRGVNTKNGHALLSCESWFFDGSGRVHKGEEFSLLYKKLESWIRINYRVIKTIPA